MKKKIIISLLALVVIIIVIAIASGSHRKSTSIVPNKAPVALNYVSNTNNGSFITITATISPDYVTSTYMPSLCKYFSQEAASHTGEYYDGNVFDDSTAPQYLGTTNNLTTAQNNDFNDHYILSYNYNPSTHNNVCNIFYGGQNGKEQSITY